MYRKIHVFIIAMILASGGIVAAIPLTNAAFATFSAQDIHCSGQNPTVGPRGSPVFGVSAGNFKCDIAANECSFSGHAALCGGHCTGTGPTGGPTECVGQLKPIAP
jgi:hypothetical protein